MNQLQMVFTDEEKERAENKADIILEMLQRGPVLSTELLPVTHRFSACVHMLKKRGYQIDVEKLDDGTSLHRLIAFRPTKAVSDDLKLAYYASEHWKTTRAARMQFDEWCCCFCRSVVSLQVHHWKYDLFNESIEDLATLCDVCHERMHQYSSVKLSFPSHVSVEVFNRLQALQQKGFSDHAH